MDFRLLLASIPADTFITTIKPLVGYSIAMALYAIFVYKFYKFLAKRDVFELKKPHESILKTMFRYVVDYILILPLYTTFWFIVMAVFMIFLSKRTTLAEILLVSMTVIAAIRICTYYKQELAEELGKLLPLIMLGTFLIDVSYFSIPRSMDLLRTVPVHWKIIAEYLGFVIILENVLRLGEFLTRTMRAKIDH